MSVIVETCDLAWMLEVLRTFEIGKQRDPMQVDPFSYQPVGCTR
jgi:hypothetical protein